MPASGNLTIPRPTSEPANTQDPDTSSSSLDSMTSLPISPSYRMPADVQARIVAFQMSRRGSNTSITPVTKSTTPRNSNTDTLNHLLAEDILEELSLSRGSTCASASSMTSYSFFSSTATSPGVPPTPVILEDTKFSNIDPLSPEMRQPLLGTQGIEIGANNNIYSEASDSSPPAPKLTTPTSPSSLLARRNLRFDTSTLFPPSESNHHHHEDLKFPIQSPLAVKSAPALPSGTRNSFSASSGPSFSSKRRSSQLLEPFNLSLTEDAISSNGAFSRYSKYVDLATGTLNFDGKAFIHSQGIEFSSGKKFNISMNDLECLEELGRGNYGTVTRVIHKPTQITMAMKEIRLELDEDKLQQIIMELDILHRCGSSPYIVEFYGAFFVEGTVYVCMEYMDGGSLDKIYGSPDEGVDEPYLAKITNSVVNALKELKENHNIIHRDVKPTNILVSSNGEVKMCDFGVSGNLVASVAKTNIGCQSYMAPERIEFSNSGRSTNNIDSDPVTYSSQSDIWSLGVTILEIASARYPYASESFDNMFSQLNAIINGEPPMLPTERFSPEAINFVQQCLIKNPELRPNYSQLLNHPWLRKWATEEADMAAFVQQRLAKRASKSLIS